jgi:hypothetical protein
MKCPLCKGTFTDPGRSKGGKVSRRKITPEQQAKMQRGRGLGKKKKKKVDTRFTMNYK